MVSLLSSDVIGRLVDICSSSRSRSRSRSRLVNEGFCRHYLVVSESPTLAIRCHQVPTADTLAQGLQLQPLDFSSSKNISTICLVEKQGSIVGSIGFFCIFQFKFQSYIRHRLLYMPCNRVVLRKSHGGCWIGPLACDRIAMAQR